MNRSLVVGLSFIGAVTVTVALWLWMTQAAAEQVSRSSSSRRPPVAVEAGRLPLDVGVGAGPQRP